MFFFKFFLGILSSFFFLTPILTLSCSDSSNNVLIREVHDGDTFTDDHKNIYRLFGVDTPEISNQYDSFNRTHGIEYQFAIEAQKFVSNLILNKKINIKIKTKDIYSRIVAMAFVGNLNLSLELLRHGLARVAFISLDPKDTYFTNESEFYREELLAQKEAYDKEVGIWALKEDFKTIFPKA